MCYRNLCRTRMVRRAAGPVADRHQSQGHRHDVFVVFAHDVFCRRGAGFVIRAELFRPGLRFFQPQLFNQLTTMHGLIMIFGAIMPAFIGLMNWHVAADDRRARHGVRAHE